MNRFEMGFETNSLAKFAVINPIMPTAENITYFVQKFN